MKLETDLSYIFTVWTKVMIMNNSQKTLSDIFEDIKAATGTPIDLKEEASEL